MSKYICTICEAPKSEFLPYDESKQAISQMELDVLNLSPAQISVLCSNFSKACKKQYLQEESNLFSNIAEYYKNRAGIIENKDFLDIVQMINMDLDNNYISANKVVKSKSDRGALRALVWSEKVTKILDSLLKRYEKDNNTMLENTNVYVCDICGFMYIGDNPPEICPVCKAPNQKISQVERV